ncbi:MAG: hypothetical protein OEZ38_02035, partial [Gammaproteobacteria bacterium]|nr:hypothetical protein [Gammaproteobacteria bacterium]
TESSSSSSIENIYLPYITYKTSMTTRFGGYYNYYYKLAVIDLKSGNRIALQDVFKEDNVLEQIQSTCDKFKCNKAENNLDGLLNTMRYSCDASTNAVIDNSIIKQFILRDIDEKRIEAKIIFQNPCKETNQEGFEPVEWVLEFKRK